MGADGVPRVHGEEEPLSTDDLPEGARAVYGVLPKHQ